MQEEYFKEQLNLSKSIKKNTNYILFIVFSKGLNFLKMVWKQYVYYPLLSDNNTLNPFLYRVYWSV